MHITNLISRSKNQCVISACLILILLLMSTAGGSAAADELRSEADVEGLCRFSLSSPDAGEARTKSTSTLLTVASSTNRRSYAFERTERILEGYQADFPSERYDFINADPLSSQINVGAYQPLGLFDGHYKLSLSNTEIPLDCDDAAMELVRVSHDAGLLRLEVEFELVSAADPGLEYCEHHEESVLIRASLLGARLVHMGTEEELCAMVSNRGLERRTRLGLGSAEAEATFVPEVEVTHLETIAGFDPASYQQKQNIPQEGPRKLDETQQLQIRNELETVLLPCYQRTLSQSGLRQGALMFRSALSPEGELQKTMVTFDMLDSEVTSGCSVETLNQLSFGELRGETGLELGITVIFRILEK